MKTYKVTLTESEIYMLEIEANSKSEAEGLAFDLIADPAGQDEYHFDSDQEAEVEEV